MKKLDLYIVHYCHKNCEPLKNIMRLPKAEAFALAKQMAEQNRETTAFYRFADFENYYPRRLKTDELLYRRFVEMGGEPLAEHPLSFVLEGSDYLQEWFGNGREIRIPLDSIPEGQISFTYGDSMAVLKKLGDFTLLTKAGLMKAIENFDGDAQAFLRHIRAEYTYIEVQVWGDMAFNDEKNNWIFAKGNKKTVEGKP